MYKINILPDLYSICRFPPNYRPEASWAYAGDFFSVSKTKDELSVICSEAFAPKNITSEGGWKLLKIEGPLDFSLIGIIAGISKLLVETNVSLFTISTFDTDYLLIKLERLEDARRALEGGGFVLGEYVL